jgi:tRNA acetyltransferase TAN1
LPGKKKVSGRPRETVRKEDTTEPNFIVTTVRGREPEACREVREILSMLGDSSPVARPTEVSGLLLGRTTLESASVLEGLQKLTESEPWRLQLTQRFIPLQAVVRTVKSEIVQAARRLAENVRPGESFRVTVEKRHSDLDTMDLVRAVADLYSSPVNLERPDKVVLVEVVGGLTGVSVLKPSEVFSGTKAKREG